jgi:hypothetical protein
VDIEVTSMTKSGRRTTVRRNQSAIRDPKSKIATIRIAVP